MSVIYDPADAELSKLQMSIGSSAVATGSIKIDCKAGDFLRCETVSQLAVEAKLDSDVSWTNLETTPIDLSPYDATRQTFNLRFTADAVSAFVRKKFRITVRP